MSEEVRWKVLDKWDFWACEKYAGYDGLRESLKNGYPVNLHEHGESPLYNASLYGYTEAVKILIEYGADVNMKHNMEQTPLMVAAWKGFDDIVKILIEAGASISQRNKYGDTAIDYAKRHKQKKILKILQEPSDE